MYLMMTKRYGRRPWTAISTSSVFVMLLQLEREMKVAGWEMEEWCVTGDHIQNVRTYTYTPNTHWAAASVIIRWRSSWRKWLMTDVVIVFGLNMCAESRVFTNNRRFNMNGHKSTHILADTSCSLCRRHRCCGHHDHHLCRWQKIKTERMTNYSPTLALASRIATRP